MGRRTKKLAGWTLAAFLLWAADGTVMATLGHSGAVVGLFVVLGAATLGLATATVVRFVRRPA